MGIKTTITIKLHGDRSSTVLNNAPDNNTTRTNKPHGDRSPRIVSNNAPDYDTTRSIEDVGKINIAYDFKENRTILEYIGEINLKIEHIPIYMPDRHVKATQSDIENLTVQGNQPFIQANQTSIGRLTVIEANQTVISYNRARDLITINFSGEAKFLLPLTLEEQGRIQITTQHES